MRLMEKTTSREANLIDRIDGLKSDLDAALSLMVRVANGSQSVARMGEWISLNYPAYRPKLPKRMRATPPKRKKRPARARTTAANSFDPLGR